MKLLFTGDVNFRGIENLDYNLLKYEAHLNQAKQIFEILFNDEVAETKIWQNKISKLMKMPL